jgi:hypothetical protein
MNNKQIIIYEYLISEGHFKNFCKFEVKYITEIGQIDNFINFINSQV